MLLHRLSSKGNPSNKSMDCRLLRRPMATGNNPVGTVFPTSILGETLFLCEYFRLQSRFDSLDEG